MEQMSNEPRGVDESAELSDGSDALVANLDKLVGRLVDETVSVEAVPEPAPKSSKPRRKAKSTMSSKEFWESKPDEPKPNISKYRVKKDKEVSLKVKEVKTETRDGRTWVVKVLEGYTGPKPVEKKGLW